MDLLGGIEAIIAGFFMLDDEVRSGKVKAFDVVVFGLCGVALIVFVVALFMTVEVKVK